VTAARVANPGSTRAASARRPKTSTMRGKNASYHEEEAQSGKEVAGEGGVEDAGEDEAPRIEDHGREQYACREGAKEVLQVTRLTGEGEGHGGGAHEAAQEPGESPPGAAAEQAHEDVPEEAERADDHDHDAHVPRHHRVVRSHRFRGQQGERHHRHDPELQEREEFFLAEDDSTPWPLLGVAEWASFSLSWTLAATLFPSREGWRW
jgi:hypothetical protein